MAHWLDTVFFPFDRAVLGAIHNFAVATGGGFDWLMKLLGLIGEGGACFIALGLILCLFKKTRKGGVCVLLALVCGAIITNICLKNIVARPRPFVDLAKPFHEWWVYMGSPHASKNSFPSGHTTSAIASMTAMFLCSKKKQYTWGYLLIGLLMGFSRMYIVVHYATDVIGGILAGAIGAVAAFFLARWLFAMLEKHRDKKLFAFVLDFDLAALFSKKKSESDGE